MTTKIIDALFLELEPVRTVLTQCERIQADRINELARQLELTESKIKTGDSEKLKTLRAELAVIVERGQQSRANRGQLVKWIRKAREKSA